MSPMGVFSNSGTPQFVLQPVDGLVDTLGGDVEFFRRLGKSPIVTTVLKYRKLPVVHSPPPLPFYLSYHPSPSGRNISPSTKD